MTSDTIAARADHLAGLIEDKLGVRRGTGLQAKLRRAGRLVPRWLQREAGRIVEAQQMMGHPRLMMQTDPQALDRAYRHCERWLQAIDPAERRRARALGFLAANAANLLFVAALFIAYMVWAGHL
ncbi:MAG: hypothetical protein GY717_17925 [Rhodobacteraceae bacterium]|nr:hypothetical protein [Paracoccaceae bacterium]